MTILARYCTYIWHEKAVLSARDDIRCQEINCSVTYDFFFISKKTISENYTISSFDWKLFV